MGYSVTIEVENNEADRYPDHRTKHVLQFETRYGAERMHSEIEALIGDVHSDIAAAEENGCIYGVCDLGGFCDTDHQPGKTEREYVEETEEEKAEDEAAAREAHEDDTKEGDTRTGKDLESAITATTENGFTVFMKMTKDGEWLGTIHAPLDMTKKQRAIYVEGYAAGAEMGAYLYRKYTEAQERKLALEKEGGAKAE